MVVSLKRPDEIKLIDFGFATRYIDDKLNKHIEREHHGNFRGTRFYASINNHKGMALSRRDDLESLAYMLIQFIYPNFLEKCFSISIT